MQGPAGWWAGGGKTKQSGHSTQELLWRGLGSTPDSFETWIQTPCPAGKVGNKWPFSAPGRTLEGKKVQQTPRPISLTTTNKSFFFPLLLLFFRIYLKLFYPLSYFLHVLYIPITLDKNCSKTVEYAPKGVDYISVTVNRDLG